MPELVLPGVFIEVRPEGLIVPQGVTVGNLGVVGTASKGPVGTPVVLGSYAEATEVFGDYDPWNDGAGELTLTRALEQAYRHGATTAWAVRVAGGSNAASLVLEPAAPDLLTLTAKTHGTWGNEIEVNVAAAEEDPFVENREHTVAADNTTTVALGQSPIVPNARTRVRVRAAGATLEESLQVVYDSGPVAGQVSLDTTSGNPTSGDLTFATPLNANDVVVASYMVSRSAGARKVTVRYRGSDEVYTILDGTDLIRDLADSAWVTATAATGLQLPDLTTPAGTFVRLVGGSNGAGGAIYQNGLDELLNKDAHIIVAAGQDASFGDELAGHCQIASSDDVKRDRIAVVGSTLGIDFSTLQGHNLASDRLIYVGPGIKTNDNAASPPVEVTLSGAYAAAAVAGFLGGASPHVSPTNKVLNVGGLETEFTRAQLKQLVLARVLALEARQGFRIVRGITTSTNTAWLQITTRRIVDYAKFGVRSAAQSYIGLLNNERVRSALRATVNSFLAEMVNDELLVSYELEVSASRDDEIRGIARVTMTLRPTFSIDFIKVTMFLE